MHEVKQELDRRAFIMKSAQVTAAAGVAAAGITAVTAAHGAVTED